MQETKLLANSKNSITVPLNLCKSTKNSSLLFFILLLLLLIPNVKFPGGLKFALNFISLI